MNYAFLSIKMTGSWTHLLIPQENIGIKPLLTDKYYSLFYRFHLEELKKCNLRRLLHISLFIFFIFFAGKQVLSEWEWQLIRNKWSKRTTGNQTQICFQGNLELLQQNCLKLYPVNCGDYLTHSLSAIRAKSWGITIIVPLSKFLKNPFKNVSRR